MQTYRAQNGKTTLTDEEIIKLYRQGMFIHQIHNKYHVGLHRIRAIINRLDV